MKNKFNMAQHIFVLLFEVHSVSNKREWRIEEPNYLFIINPICLVQNLPKIHYSHSVA